MNCETRVARDITCSRLTLTKLVSAVVASANCLSDSIKSDLLSVSGGFTVVASGTGEGLGTGTGTDFVLLDFFCQESFCNGCDCIEIHIIFNRYSSPLDHVSLSIGFRWFSVLSKRNDSAHLYEIEMSRKGAIRHFPR